jgi:eukaryotic-like serine/threonine-protein kinase
VKVIDPTPRLHPGAVVLGRYEALRKIGEGAFAEVWLAKERSRGNHVALKRLHGAFIDDAEVVERMRREAYFLSRVESEHVVKVAELVVDPVFSVVLVMEYVEGHVLSRLMGGTLLDVEEAIELGIDLLRGLCDLHAVRVIHRDLKPGNIILRPVSGGYRAIIFDFSLSRLARSVASPRPVAPIPVRFATPPLRAITRTNVTLGTLEYMPPEQILDSREVDQRSDIYALGAILYTAVAGEHPFAAFEGARQLARAKLEREAPPIATSRSDPLALEFEVALARALRRRPADRFASALEMLAELRRMRALPGYWEDLAPSRGTGLVRRGARITRHFARARDGVVALQVSAAPSSHAPAAAGEVAAAAAPLRVSVAPAVAPPSAVAPEPSAPAIDATPSAREPKRPRAGLWTLLAIALLAALIASLALRHATTPSGELPPTAH